MTDPNRLLNEIRIASPCSASWDEMAGDETVRFCRHCNLDVYNLSRMTAADAAALVEGRMGRLCVRLYRRADGTVLTQDCPVGVRARLRRMARAAGMALTALLGLFPVTATRAEQHALQGQPARVEEPVIVMGGIRPVPRDAAVTVEVAGEGGILVGNASVELTDLRTGESTAAVADGDGTYRFFDVGPGIYTLTATAPGHAASRPKTVRVKRDRPVRLAVTLGER
jgi:hypothetical protein